jgi:hypothetical protein
MVMHVSGPEGFVKLLGLPALMGLAGRGTVPPVER